MIKYEFPCYPGDEVWYIDSSVTGTGVGRIR